MGPAFRRNIKVHFGGLSLGDSGDWLSALQLRPAHDLDGKVQGFKGLFQPPFPKRIGNPPPGTSEAFLGP